MRVCGSTGMVLLCEKHGGNLDIGNGILCDTCSREGINLCKCGGVARYFGEALGFNISCDDCEELLYGCLSLKREFNNVRERWNAGDRGYIDIRNEQNK